MACGLGCGDGRSAGQGDAAAPDAQVPDATVPDATAPQDDVVEAESFELVFEPILPIANETIIFPPALDQAPSRTLSERETGDVLVAYTRVGCRVDPEAFIGQNRGLAVRPTPPVHLASVTIEQSGDGVSSSLAQLGEQTCLSVRPPGGTWQPFLEPAVVTIDDDIVLVRFETASALTDAVAIFLPTYTNISRITYRAAAAP